jgi:hypothetical protein
MSPALGRCRVTWASVVAGLADREPEPHSVGAADDLFEYQSNPLGGWLMPDVAGYAI